MKINILSIVVAALVLVPSVQRRAFAQQSDFILCGTPQQEADTLKGFNLGRSTGAKRAREGFPKPTLDYLDAILKATVPDASEAYKVGFKAGYIDGWEKKDGTPL